MEIGIEGASLATLIKVRKLGKPFFSMWLKGPTEKILQLVELLIDQPMTKQGPDCYRLKTEITDGLEPKDGKLESNLAEGSSSPN